jgi:hypothetical protein
MTLPYANEPRWGSGGTDRFRIADEMIRQTRRTFAGDASVLRQSGEPSVRRISVGADSLSFGDRRHSRVSDSYAAGTNFFFSLRAGSRAFRSASSENGF